MIADFHRLRIFKYVAVVSKVYECHCRRIGVIVCVLLTSILLGSNVEC